MRNLLFLITLAPAACAAATCEQLAALQLPDTAIVSAVPAAAGNGLPAHCKVNGVVRPVPGSEIRFEVWLPEAGWNERFHAVGNGGFAGSLALASMADPLKRGFATATTDTGHKGGDGAWAAGHPERVVDYGHRAIHEMTVKAKAIIAAYYGKAPIRSYFASCSNGGRQALMEAQRYPADYDGIIAGAPANDFTHIMTGFLWNQQALLLDPASRIPASKMKALEAAVLAECDQRDGAADGLIDDPRRCHFDPASLVCGGAENDSCLTAPQITALKKIYAGPKDAQGRQVFPGFVPGGEAGSGGWEGWITATPAEKSAQYFFATQFFANLVFDGKPRDWRTVNFDNDLTLTNEKLARTINSTDPNLTAFLRRGGKLILYHGWCDAALTPLNTIRYYENVTARTGKRLTTRGVRLYMMPGVQHCAGGPGPDQVWGRNGTPSDERHDLLKAVQAWVEQGRAPKEIVASKAVNGKVTRTRPLCPYPLAAKYSGHGSIDDAASFVCK